MNMKYDVVSKLEDIQYKYERMEALICVLQMFVCESVDITGAPEDTLQNALYEIEIGMMDNNAEFKKLVNERIKVA